MIFLGDTGYLLTQKNDFNWLCGYAGGKGDLRYGVSVLNFRKGNVEIKFDPDISMYLLNTNTVISDHDGNLMLYSNGQSVNNSLNQLITGADTLYDNSMSKGGIPIDYASLILDKPGSTDEYFIFYTKDSAFQIQPPFGSSSNTVGLRYATIKVNQINPGGLLLARDQFLIRDTIWGTGLTACRHANGRDWWILIGELPPSTGIYKCLVDPNGIHIVEKQLMDSYIIEGVSQNCFFPDGNYFLHYTQFSKTVGAFIYLFKFDRCTGLLEPVFEYEFDYTGIYGGICFSPDSKKIYLGHSSKLYQINLEDPMPWESKVLLDTIDPVPFWGMSYSFFNNGPDGKIYIGTGYIEPFLHIIQNPNLLGTNCQAIRSGIKLQNFNSSTPNLPHFRLGPIDGSICDSLGLDNIPWAWWRYEQDSIDYLSFEFKDLSKYDVTEWEWDFDDGSTSSLQSPTHRFFKPGSYEVCLIAKNINGADTFCRNLNIVTVDNQNLLNTIPIKLFPNPNSGFLILNVSDYIPNRMLMKIFDIYGNLTLTKKLYEGTNGISLQEFQNGVYIISITELGREILIDKILKF